MAAVALVPVGIAAWRARRPDATGALAVLFDYYIIGCVVVIFDGLGPLIHAVHPVDYDAALIAFDRALFGTDPTVALEKIATPFLSDVLTLFYALYYFHPIVLGTLVLLDDRGRPAPARDFPRYAFVIVFVFYVSYACYFLVPALHAGARGTAASRCDLAGDRPRARRSREEQARLLPVRPHDGPCGDPPRSVSPVEKDVLGVPAVRGRPVCSHGLLPVPLRRGRDRGLRARARDRPYRKRALQPLRHQPVAAVDPAAEDLEGLEDVEVVLEHPRELRPLVADADAFLHGLVVEDGVEAPLAVFRQHSERHRAAAVDLFPLLQELQPAEREQRPAHLHEDLVEIRKREVERGGLPVDLREEDVGRVNDGLELFRHRVDLVGRHRHEAPVLLPRPVVDGLDDREVLVEPLHADRPHDELRLAAPHALREAREALERDVAHRREDRDEVLLLRIARAREQVEVIRGVVRHHQERQSRIALLRDERAHLVVQRRVRGAAQPVAAGQQLAHRAFGRGEKRPARLDVVLAFEESEKTRLVRVDAVVLRVRDRRDAAHDLPCAPRQKKLPLCMFPERVLRLVEHPADIRAQRWRPARVAGVNSICQLDEFLEVGLGGDGIHPQGCRIAHVSTRLRLRTVSQRSGAIKPDRPGVRMSYRASPRRGLARGTSWVTPFFYTVSSSPSP